ncbi:MAG: histidine phosphatase family protein [Bdellovibrionales bacterium]|nr:histidine phosphatase family protein [Massilia sp.]
MRLHLIRHLAPLVAAGTCYGRTDLAVDATAQARAVPALRARLPAGVPVFSSPLVRCAWLALALAREADVRIDARLLELDFGKWEMRSWDQIARVEIEAWAADVAAYRPGGGESVTEMALRIDAFYAALMREHWADVVIVCHAGAMRLLSARQAGLSPAEMAREAAQQPHAIGYGEIIVLDCV